MKIVVAIDSFKGCLSSAEANAAAAEGIRSVCPDAEVVQVPVSDGGEGFLEAYRSAMGGELMEVEVHDPLMHPVRAKYLLRRETAVIEIAQASGLMLLAEAERNPMAATSYGTGELVAAAVRKGAKHIIVGLGGSATSDAGTGMLQAIADNFSEASSHDILCDNWGEIKSLKNIRFTIATDVKNPLYGERGAAHVFAPQKGATEEMVLQLDERARRFAETSARHFGYDRSNEEGAGAAGGLGYAFLQYLNAECKPGIELLLETIGFDEIIHDADLIITGEGAADRQTLMGKLPMGILRHARSTSQASPTPLPVCLLAGQILDKEALLRAGFSHVECIHPTGIPLKEAMQAEVAMRNISATASRLCALVFKKEV